MRDRKIGEVLGKTNRVLLITAAVHGDEPSGVSAVERVFRKLGPLKDSLAGTCVAFVGNVRALNRRKFCLEANLNRLWFAERTAQLEAGENFLKEFIEDKEQEELFQAMEPYLSLPNVTFVDLHATGSKTGPFVFADSPSSETLADRLVIPNVQGLGENSSGELYQYVSTRGAPSLRVIAGTRGTAKAIQCHEALLWNLLVELEFLDPRLIPDYEEQTELLAQASRGVPGTVHILYRHQISPVDGFHMAPGIRNFQDIGRGDVVAFDKHGAIKAPKSGLIFMPSYRLPSDYGFHIVGENPPLSQPWWEEPKEVVGARLTSRAR